MNDIRLNHHHNEGLSQHKQHYIHAVTVVYFLHSDVTIQHCLYALEGQHLYRKKNVFRGKYIDVRLPPLPQ